MSEPVNGPRQPTISVVVVQPTPFCNINCNYCYLPDRKNKATMSQEVLQALFEKVFASGWACNQLTVIWHAGEPLVMPVSYYEEAFNLIESLRPQDIQVRHSFQTNGTLLSRSWCDLFKWASSPPSVHVTDITLQQPACVREALVPDLMNDLVTGTPVRRPGTRVLLRPERQLVPGLADPETPRIASGRQLDHRKGADFGPVL